MTKTYILHDKDRQEVSINREELCTETRIKTPKELQNEIESLDTYIAKYQQLKAELQEELIEVNKLLT